jgi:hypothetical protein
MRSVQLLQRCREAAVGEVHDRVVVRSHQGVGDDRDLEALECPCELGEEAQALGVGLEQKPCIACPGGDVVQTREEGPWATRHPSSVRANDSRNPGPGKDLSESRRLRQHYDLTQTGV